MQVKGISFILLCFENVALLAFYSSHQAELKPALFISLLCL